MDKWTEDGFRFDVAYLKKQIIYLWIGLALVAIALSYVLYEVLK